MKARRYALVALALCSLGHAESADLRAAYDWKQARIGGGGFVTGIVSHPGVSGLFYCRTDVGGAYRRLPGCTQWEQIVTSTSMPAALVQYASFDGVDGVAVSRAASNTVYVAYKGTVLRSDDRGGHFTTGNLSVFMNANDEGRYHERLAVDPGNANVVYLGTRTNGLWRTLDGQTWTRLAGVPAGAFTDNGDCGIARVLIDPSSGAVSNRSNVVYTFLSGNDVGGGGVFCSTNGGSGWSDISTVSGKGPGAHARLRDAALTASGRVICCTSRNVWAYRGGAWQEITPAGLSSSLADVAADPREENRIVLTADNGMHLRTTNGGTNWSAPMPPLRRSPDIPWLATTDESWFSTAEVIFDACETGRLWTAQGIGVWTSDDLGGGTSITWTAASQGIEEMVTTDMIVPAGGSPLVTVWDRTAFRLDDLDRYTAAQIPVPTFSSGWNLANQAANPRFVVLAAYRHNWWFGANDFSGWSDDGGRAWHTFAAVTNGTQPADLRFGDIAVAANDPDNIVRVPAADVLPYFTTNRGRTWVQSAISQNGTPIQKGGYGGYYVRKKMLIADPSRDHTFLLYQWEQGLFISTNAGRHFTLHSTGLPAWRWHPCLRAVEGKQGHFWFGPGCEDAGRGPLLRSTDGGATWFALGGLDGVSVVGFGKAAPGSNYPAIYVEGAKDGQPGVFRSIDEGASWDRLSGYPLDLYDRVTVIEGDKTVFGRVYVAFAGNSMAYGQPRSKGTVLQVAETEPIGIGSPIAEAPSLATVRTDRVYGGSAGKVGEASLGTSQTGR